jgi:hypothetical protein
MPHFISAVSAFSAATALNDAHLKPLSEGFCRISSFKIKERDGLIL